MKRKLLNLCALIAVISSFALLFACGSDGSKKYKVTFDTLGGSSVSGYSLEAGSKIKRPSKIPTKEMFVFDDWYADRALSAKFEFGSKMPKNNVTIYAGWLGQASVTVTFDANSGQYADLSTAKSVVGDVGAELVAPETQPTKTGYTFSGWYTDKECTTASAYNKYPSENITLYAGWGKNPGYAYVSYYGNGKLISVQPVVKNQPISVPTLFDEYTEISGWYKDSNMTAAYSFGAMVNEDMNLYTTYYTRGLVVNNGVVTGYTGPSCDVVVPSIYNGKTVTEIGDFAFLTPASVKSITSITLPATVTKIGEGAFEGCSYLVRAYLTSGVKTIGASAFLRNERLKSVGDISSVTEIGEAAFAGCTDLLSVELPETLTAIGAYAFSDCALLTEMIVPSKVEDINGSLFAGCASLGRVEFKSVALKTIAGNVFDKCQALTDVVMLTRTVPAFTGVTAGVTDSPFAGAPNAKIYVQKTGNQSLLNSFKHEYGYLDGGTLSEKFEEIG